MISFASRGGKDRRILLGLVELVYNPEGEGSDLPGTFENHVTHAY